MGSRDGVCATSRVCVNLLRAASTTTRAPRRDTRDESREDRRPMTRAHCSVSRKGAPGRTAPSSGIAERAIGDLPRCARRRVTCACSGLAIGRHRCRRRARTAAKGLEILTGSVGHLPRLHRSRARVECGRRGSMRARAALHALVVCRAREDGPPDAQGITTSERAMFRSVHDGTSAIRVRRAARADRGEDEEPRGATSEQHGRNIVQSGSGA